MVYKKNVILNSLHGDDKKALLALECNGNTTSGKLRLYNFDEQPKGIVTLGVYHDHKVTKAGMIYLGGMVYSLNLDMKELPLDFSCCMLNFVGGEAKPILYSSTAIKDKLDEAFASLPDARNMEEVEKILDEKEIEYDDDLKEEINSEIDKSMACASSCGQDCESCKYKLYYEENHKDENSLKQNDDEVDKDFYHEMKEHLDKIFADGEEESYLESLISQSKWTKVKLDKGEYYVVGIIRDDDEIKYICYGVPGVYQEIAPKELSGYPVWFPLDESNPKGFGYWLSYQDAKSGDSVKAVVVE